MLRRGSGMAFNHKYGLRRDHPLPGSLTTGNENFPTRDQRKNKAGNQHRRQYKKTLQVITTQNCCSLIVECYLCGSRKSKDNRQKSKGNRQKIKKANFGDK